MNKKLRKLKKDVKRELISIGYKKAARDLKNEFLRKFKTAIYDSSYINENNLNGSFHPSWGENHPTITEYSDCWGKSEQLATLNINRLSRQIAYYMSKRDHSDPEWYTVECYHPKSGNSWVTF